MNRKSIKLLAGAFLGIFVGVVSGLGITPPLIGLILGILVSIGFARIPDTTGGAIFGALVGTFIGITTLPLTQAIGSGLNAVGSGALVGSITGAAIGALAARFLQ